MQRYILAAAELLLQRTMGLKRWVYWRVPESFGTNVLLLCVLKKDLSSNSRKREGTTVMSVEWDMIILVLWSTMYIVPYKININQHDIWVCFNAIGDTSKYAIQGPLGWNGAISPTSQV